VRALVVVPALNEEQSVGVLIREIQTAAAELGFDIAIAVVDDGSRDRTAQVSADVGARVLRLCRNLGIGGAVQTGLRLAWREGFDCAIQMDGDGQHPPSELGKLFSALGTNPRPDLVVGTRYKAEKSGFRSTFLRRLGSLWLRLVLRAATRLKASDPTSGYRLYGPRALALFSTAYPYDYPEPESLAMAKAAGLTIAEVPVVMRHRRVGTSSIRGWRAPYYVLKVTLAVVLAYVRAVGRSQPRFV